MPRPIICLCEFEPCWTVQHACSRTLMTLPPHKAFLSIQRQQHPAHDSWSSQASTWECARTLLCWPVIAALAWLPRQLPGW